MRAHIIRTHIDGSSSVFRKIDVTSQQHAEKYLTDVLQYEIGDMDRIAIEKTRAENPEIDRYFVRYHIEFPKFHTIVGVGHG